MLATVVRTLRRPRVATLTGLYLFGLFALFLAPAPSKITEEKLAAYNTRLEDAQSIVDQLAVAEQHLMHTELALRDVSVWFWRFRPEHREQVLQARKPVQAAKQRVNALRKERDGVLRDAKASLGLWSEAGVEEYKELLWSTFQSGKVFAQRQTLWDSIFALFDSREKDTIFLLFQILFTALINYTIGTVMSIFTYLLLLPSLLSTFAPSFFSATLFFCVAGLAAVSLLVTYLGLLYSAGAAVVMTSATFLRAHYQRLEAEQRRRPEALNFPPQRGRAHYE